MAEPSEEHPQQFSPRDSEVEESSHNNSSLEGDHPRFDPHHQFDADGEDEQEEEHDFEAGMIEIDGSFFILTLRYHCASRDNIQQR